MIQMSALPSAVLTKASEAPSGENAAASSMASRVAVTVLAAFVFLDLAKFFISERFGTGAAWLLQQDVRALRRSVAQATTPRSLAHRVARERLLRDKERTLLRMQTATLRRTPFRTLM